MPGVSEAVLERLKSFYASVHMYPSEPAAALYYIIRPQREQRARLWLADPPVAKVHCTLQ
jgi:hypothetical protein